MVKGLRVGKETIPTSEDESVQKDTGKKMKSQSKTRRKYSQIIYLTKDSHLETSGKLSHSSNKNNSVFKGPEHLITHFTKEEMQIANEHRKRRSTSLVIREI